MPPRARLRRPIFHPLLALAFALVAAACGDDDASSDTDGGALGPDGSTDAAITPDGSLDEDASVVPDGSTPPDGGPDSGEPDSGGPDGGEPDGGEPDAGDAGDDGGTENELRRATPEEIAVESAADYADNEHGLIAGTTLARFIGDWPAERPDGVTGKLVVLQVVPSVATSLKHVAGNGTHVASYLVPEGELTQLRNNGLSQIEAEIPDGAAVDAFLTKYGIDVEHDYIAITFEQLPATETVPATLNAIVQQAGRAWLLLRYWGYPAERIGILDGSINWNETHQGLVLSSALPATPPNNGTSSVRDLWIDNTQLVITLDELLAILKEDDGARPLDAVRIIDARGGAEAYGLLKATRTSRTDCTSYTGTGANTRCSPIFEGRIKGSHSVPWTQFVRPSADGFRFLDKAAVKDLFDTQSGYQAGEHAIQYCRTNVRSLVTGIVAGVILGYPTRFYDTSFIEWSHLAYGPTARTRTLPEDSAYRTDIAALTEHATVSESYTPGLAFDSAVHTITGWVDGPNYNADDDISPTAPLIVPSATTASQSVIDDRAYKLQP